MQIECMMRKDVFKFLVCLKNKFWKEKRFALKNVGCAKDVYKIQ